MSKKEELKERWEKVKDDYSIQKEDYPKELFDKLEKMMIEKPKAFEYRLKTLERKEPISEDLSVTIESPPIYDYIEIDNDEFDDMNNGSD